MALLIKHRDRELEPTWGWPAAMLPSLRWFEDVLHGAEGLIKVEEFTENGTLVVRAELPGIDPDKDVEITLENGLLHITAERSEDEEKTERCFQRRELRYGSFVRSVALPEDVDESSVAASYKDGILEVRVPLSAEPPKEPTRHIPVARS